MSMMTAAQSDFASLTDIRIGTRLGEIKRQLLTLGEDLEGMVHQRVAGFVNDRLKGVEAHSCRIAVIGQIKAGKSSLVNAMTRRPDLLPTDVNPSTAVITKLYFGGPAEKANSALFHFFSDDEWERIMSGGRAGPDAASQVAGVGVNRMQGRLEELRERARAAPWTAIQFAAGQASPVQICDQQRAGAVCERGRCCWLSGRRRQRRPALFRHHQNRRGASRRRAAGLSGCCHRHTGRERPAPCARRDHPCQSGRRGYLPAGSDSPATTLQRATLRCCGCYAACKRTASSRW